MSEPGNRKRFFKMDLGETGVSYVRASSADAARQNVLQDRADGVEVGQPAELTETEFNADVEALFGL